MSVLKSLPFAGLTNGRNYPPATNFGSERGFGRYDVDIVRFITGLKPPAVSGYGAKDRLPNGNEGYLCTDERVL